MNKERPQRRRTENLRSKSYRPKSISKRPKPLTDDQKLERAGFTKRGWFKRK